MTASLLIADDVVTLDSLSQDFQYALGQCIAKGEAAGMRMSTSKSEVMVLDRKKVDCLLHISGEPLAQGEELKYLMILFMSDGV